MKRYHITLGAGTTAGGKVITASSGCSSNGIKVALDQSEANVVLRFLDEFSEAPLAGKRYRLELPEKIIQGQTDAEGYSEPIAAADRDRLMAWQIVD